MTRTEYQKETKINTKTGQEYVFLGPKTERMARVIDLAQFEAMSQARVGMAMDKEA